MQAGGFVHDGRVNGTLNLSRALGDMEFKRGAQLPPAEQVMTSPDSHYFSPCASLIVTAPVMHLT